MTLFLLTPLRPLAPRRLLRRLLLPSPAASRSPASGPRSLGAAPLTPTHQASAEDSHQQQPSAPVSPVASRSLRPGPHALLPLQELPAQGQCHPEACLDLPSS